ncbi:MAG TPA: NUDIX hydrolase [Candidatus Yonathbacteria bacterium]|nr:NUDIX hydrolase [Candidatus Yonathbacteria bacterium]
MQIESSLVNSSDQTLKVLYNEGNPLDNLDGRILQAVHAYCFDKDELVIVYAESKKYWTPPGGGIEKGETYEEATIREIAEETNMRVLHQEFIGYQDIWEPHQTVRQTRSMCIVEPIGDFVSDPDGEVTEIKLINPKDYRQYFDWGVIGERIMKQALEMKESYVKDKGLG